MRRQLQWRKWRRPVKTIVAPALSTASITSRSRPARLDEGVDAGLEREPGPVREWEEGIRGEVKADDVHACRVPSRRDPDRVDAAHLAGGDPDRLQVLGDHDRVRRHVLADPRGEEQVAPAPRWARRSPPPSPRGPRRPSRGHTRAGRRAHACSPAPTLPPSGARCRSRSGSTACARAPQARPRRSPARTGPRRSALRAAPRRGADGAVEDDDAAVGRRRIRCEGHLVRLFDRRADADAARVHMLHDHAGRQRELHHEHPRRVEVVEVVERELAPVQLLDAAGACVRPARRSRRRSDAGSRRRRASASRTRA